MYKGFTRISKRRIFMSDNVDTSFTERLRLKNLQLEINAMIETIEATSNLNNYFGPMVGESQGYFMNVPSFDVITDPDVFEPDCTIMYDVDTGRTITGVENVKNYFDMLFAPLQTIRPELRVI